MPDEGHHGILDKLDNTFIDKNDSNDPNKLMHCWTHNLRSTI